VAPVEKLIAEAVKKNSDHYEKRLSDLNDAHGGYINIGQKVYTALRAKGVPLTLYTGEDHSAVAKLCAKYATQGKDFDTLMCAVKEDTMLASEWDRFAMMLRLRQED